MYRKTSNSRYVVVGISGIVLVMSIFTWLMYGIADRINVMTETIVQLGADVHAMTEIQYAMTRDISSMAGNIGHMQASVNSMSRNVELMTGTTMSMNQTMNRLGYDVNRSSTMFSSPMDYFWNMGQ